MEAINEILQIEIREYENINQDFWLRWCENNAIEIVKDGAYNVKVLDVKLWQLLLANSSLNQWFNMEFQKCEMEFRATIKRYEGSPTVTAVDLKKCYFQALLPIFSIYPKAIIESISKKKKQPSIKVEGIKVRTLTFNQN